MSKAKNTQEKNKKNDQVGNDIEESLHDEQEMDLVQILLPRKDIDEIVEHRHEKFSKSELSRQGQWFMALAFIQGAKALLSVTSKEKAKEAMAKVVYDFAYMGAREAAEKRGNPKDLISYLEFEEEALVGFPFIPPGEVFEKTKNRIVYGIQICPFADSVRELAEKYPNYVDQDVLEVVTSRCETLDTGRADGWNPDMKFKRTHFKLADLVGDSPSEGCYFEAEVPEK